MSITNERLKALARWVINAYEDNPNTGPAQNYIVGYLAAILDAAGVIDQKPFNVRLITEQKSFLGFKYRHNRRQTPFEFVMEKAKEFIND